MALNKGDGNSVFYWCGPGEKRQGPLGPRIHYQQFCLNNNTFNIGDCGKEGWIQYATFCIARS